MTSKWYRNGNYLINLDKCVHILMNKNSEKISEIGFYDNNNNKHGDIQYSIEDSTLALEDFNKIIEIVTNKDELTKLKDEIAELRKMIIHLPVVGSVYVEAKEEFEANSKIDN
jgi:hypothetical protein